MRAHFSGNPKTEWLPDGRSMRLLEDFWFTDAAGRVWMAHVGSVIDGASIPEALKNFIGCPFTGWYRNASVVHDVACEESETEAERREADLMFREACIVGGCPPGVAERMLRGVTWGTFSEVIGGHLTPLPIPPAQDHHG